MVRFIIEGTPPVWTEKEEFTFQYGQIYYKILFHLNKFRYYIYIPIWLDLLSALTSAIAGVYCYLHSNMVRFIIMYIKPNTLYAGQFTFQYGQIYYLSGFEEYTSEVPIYIPIWLDLLYQPNPNPLLHFTKFTFQYGQIYYF